MVKNDSLYKMKTDMKDFFVYKDEENCQVFNLQNEKNE